MAISIPIVSEFNAKGIDKAVREFQKLETAGQKAQFVLQKSAVPAAAALGVLTYAAFDAVKAFAEDEKSAVALATTLKNVTGATDNQVEALEKFITKTSFAVSVADDQLRPALGTLVRATGDVTQAQKLLGLALDISAGTGKDLGAVSEALGKAFNGQMGPLKKLAPALADLIDEGATTGEVFKALSDTFGGQASAAADTASGRMEGLRIRMDEIKESVGEAVMPIVEKLMPAFTSMSDWASDNTGLIVGIAGAIAAITAAVIIANVALKAYAVAQAIASVTTAVLTASTYALWAATGIGVIVAIVAGILLLAHKFGILGDFVDGVTIIAEYLWNTIKSGYNWVVNNWGLMLAVIAAPFTAGIGFVILFKDKIVGIFRGIVDATIEIFSSIANAIYSPFKTVFNAIAELWNGTVGALHFEVPSWVPLGLGGKTFDGPKIPILGDGGIVTGPTLAMIGERGPEAVIPLNRAGGGVAGNTINVNVTSANPQEVVRALQKYVRLNGNVPLNTRGM